MSHCDSQEITVTVLKLCSQAAGRRQTARLAEHGPVSPRQSIIFAIERSGLAGLYPASDLDGNGWQVQRVVMESKNAGFGGQCSFGGFDKFGVYPVHEAAKDVPKL
jgi:hypothetical protein